MGWADPLEKEVATHSSTLAWEIPWTEEPGRLQSVRSQSTGSQRVGRKSDYRETMETVTDFLFLGFKIPADGDCSHEIKRRLLLGRKVMTNLDSIFK